LATTIENQLGVKEEKIDEKSEEKKEEISHHSILVKLLAEELKCKVEQIIDFELCLSDFQDSVIGGIKEEFVFSQRLDNLMSCFCALDSYINTIDSLENDSDVRMITFFDHEEVGSNSMNGAGSTMISDILQRVTEIFKDEKTGKDALYTSISKSFIISSDMAHSCHPNYSDKHEVNHKIQMHKGPVVKVNVQQRYATSLPTSFLIKELAKKKNIPIQYFCVKNDTVCGSTIGPIMSTNLSIRTVDIGNPMLSMHSIRETCGTIDITYSCQLFSTFFNDFRDLDEKLEVDFNE